MNEETEEDDLDMETCKQLFESSNCYSACKNLIVEQSRLQEDEIEAGKRKHDRDYEIKNFYSLIKQKKESIDLLREDT